MQQLNVCVKVQELSSGINGAQSEHDGRNTKHIKVNYGISKNGQNLKHISLRHITEHV